MKTKILLTIIIGMVAVAGGAWSFTEWRHDKQEQQVTAMRNLEAFQNKTIVAETRADEHVTATNTDAVVAAKKSPSPQVVAITMPPIVTSVAKQELCVGSLAVDFLCYDDFFRELVVEEGIPAAFERLRREYGKNSYIKAQCHPLAHVIGRAATKLFTNVADAYREGDSFCWSGYYHGVMEGVLADVGSAGIAGVINAICTPLA